MLFKNTLVLGFITGTASTAIGLLFAYVEVYVKLKTKVFGEALRACFHASCGIPTICSIFVHDHAFWKERPDQQVPASHI